MKEKTFVRALLSTVAVLATAIAVITFSIGLPIYFRPFYYMQIEPLGIEEATGYSREEIIEGYDEVLDYLTRPGGEFSAGVFKYSESGASHFDDCKALFTLNAVAFVICAMLIVLVVYLERKRGVRLCRPLGLSPYSFAGGVTLFTFATLGILVSVDFDRAFRIFHAVFFPGKDNWLFDPRLDEIILAMPSDFFMNATILIASSIILICIVLLAVGTVRAVKLKRK